MQIIVNKARAWEVFQALIHALRSKTPPFDKVQTLEYPIPASIQAGSVGHAIFLFCSCYYMRGKINSNTALDLLGVLYQKEEWMFDPKHFQNLSSDNARVASRWITALLVHHGLGFNAVEVGEQWVHNMTLLADYWHGNPIEIFDSANEDYEVLCTVLMKSKKSKDPAHGFYGFREKMVSMLSYFYIHADIVRPFPHPVPVDFHILRILVSQEILSADGIGSKSRLSVDRLSRSARSLTLEFCAVTGIEPKELADALWHMSREFCVEHPGNSSSVGHYKGRRTPINVKPVRWTENQHSRYHRTCGRCVVETTCKWNVASANYYVQGVVEIRGERKKPLDLFL